ncbi:MAG TPA: hypothetical protein VIL55_11740 [Naasia sp.]|jgi:hypothetical protein
MTSRKADTREWAKIATDLPQHPKLAAMEDPAPAGWTWVVAILYSRRHLTDGVIPVAGVLREASVARPVADQLVTAGAWHLPGHDCPRCPQPPAGHAYVHDYLQHNQSREQVEAAREAGRKAANVRHSRRRSATSEGASYGSHADRTAESVRDAEPPADVDDAPSGSGADRTADRMPPASDPEIPADRTADRMRVVSAAHAGPSAEVEVEEEVTTDPPALRAGPPARSTRGARLDPAWRPSPAVREQLAAECPTVDLVAEFRKFTDYWTAIPGAKGRKLDWDATFRNWIRRAAENAPAASRRPAGRPSRTDRARAAVAAAEQRYGPGVIRPARAIGAGS